MIMKEIRQLSEPLGRGADMNVLLRDAQTKPDKEVFVSGMAQR